MNDESEWFDHEIQHTAHTEFIKMVSVLVTECTAFVCSCPHIDVFVRNRAASPVKRSGVISCDIYVCVYLYRLGFVLVVEKRRHLSDHILVKSKHFRNYSKNYTKWRNYSEIQSKRSQTWTNVVEIRKINIFRWNICLFIPIWVHSTVFSFEHMAEKWRIRFAPSENY